MLPPFVWTLLFVALGVVATLQLQESRLQPRVQLGAMAVFWLLIVVAISRVIGRC